MLGEQCARLMPRRREGPTDYERIIGFESFKSVGVVYETNPFEKLNRSNRYPLLGSFYVFGQ